MQNTSTQIIIETLQIPQQLGIAITNNFNAQRIQTLLVPMVFAIAQEVTSVGTAAFVNQKL